MSTSAIREKLHAFVDSADDKQIEVLYSIFEYRIAEKYDPWTDEDFLKELKSRIDEYESGTVKGIPWEEVKLKVRAEYKAKHQ